jgi:hypothetical protein
MFLLLVAPLASAANVSGNWTGSLEFKSPEGDAQRIPAHAEFKQLDKAITGSVWKDAEHQFRIENGKIEGNNMTFEFNAPEGDEDNMLVHKASLTMTSPTQMEGKVEVEADGNRLTGKLTLTRDK